MYSLHLCQMEVEPCVRLCISQFIVTQCHMINKSAHREKYKFLICPVFPTTVNFYIINSLKKGNSRLVLLLVVSVCSLSDAVSAFLLVLYLLTQIIICTILQVCT